ncbi:MAG: hypothetical protein COT00_00245 [Candidatus Omnitrophica bacterium CG07_land_8_20_14_0_80_50_8]|nr:MAG: hypothetical protein AUJ71_03505 [Candidatus Omnitrophica bacterium CG1_02_49_16]PIU40712.1 MAG: hypothetical protein COT00_00245 [Candidatus Omnitrophica bacterium CG07_land_8_20_14_0_80_50_8]
MDSGQPDHLAEEHYLDIREASEILDVNEQELWDLVHKHAIPTHSIAGAFLRFKKEDIEGLKIKWRIERELFPHLQATFVHDSTVGRVTFVEKLKDFWYFNDYYILCLILVVILLHFIAVSQ